MKKISPQRYIQGFFIIVICLALARELTPSLAFSTKEQLKTKNEKFNIKPYKKPTIHFRQIADHSNDLFK